MNVAELVLAQRDLRAGSSGYAVLLCVYGIGMVAGSLAGARDDLAAPELRRRWLAGLALIAIGLLGAAAAPGLALAAAAFAVTGAGNGVFNVAGRILLLHTVPEARHGRAFGLLDAICSWGLAGAALTGGALASGLGGRGAFALAGGGALLVALAAARTLPPRPAAPAAHAASVPARLPSPAFTTS
jgi:MFS family permease